MIEEIAFRNLEVNPRALPRVEDLVYTPIEKRYVRVLWINWAILLLLLLVPYVLILIKGELDNNMLFSLIYLGSWLILSVVVFIISPILVAHQKYAMREKDIHYQKGWLWQKHISIPFHRIQHCELNRGVISRSLGLSQLKIFTAGGATSDLTIPGLPEEQAQSLRAFIISKTELIHDEEE